MKTGPFHKLGLIIALLASVFSQQVTAGDKDGIAPDSVKAGMSVPLTGPAAGNGIAIKEAVDSYFKRVNAGGGVHGRKISLLAEDDQYEPDQTVNRVTKLLKEDKVFALLSIFGGPTTAAVLPLVRREEAPLIGPISSANISEPVEAQVFAVRPNAYHEAEILIERLSIDRGFKKFAVLYQDDAFGNAGLAAVERSLAKRGLKIVAKGKFKRNTTEVDEAVTTLTQTPSDAIILFGVGAGPAAFVNRFFAAGGKAVIAGTTATATPVFFKETSVREFEFVVALSSPSIDDSSSEVVKSYLADAKSNNSKSINQYGLDAYIAAMIYVDGLKRTGKDLSRTTFRKALESMNNVVLEGVKISFTPQDHQGIDQCYLARYKGGKLVPVRTFAKE